ncbi:hypothetical protein FA13DRAFT_1815870 [Coprinellus micaceus]|uniref:Uncharacterized protein n=1 Tax=Coprinellus micaceus TaxID=71717 RepID=A0A4Y7T434_COPMI|nr:hypothetical protein FA13DRAFT_1815870 [Coprinellus micaceus]
MFLRKKTNETADEGHYKSTSSTEHEPDEIRGTEAATTPTPQGQEPSISSMPDHAETYPLDGHSSFPRKVPMPEGLAQMFKGFVPYLIDFAGVQDDPWNVGDEPIFRQWFGYLKNVLKKDLYDETDRAVIVSNAQYQLSLWRDSIATRALLHLTDNLDALPTFEDRRQWVLDRLYLHDVSPRCLPLYFRKIKNSKGLRVRVDLYQAPIVASALSIHLYSVRDVPEHLRMPRMAVGALILSLQASLRAAELWKSGQQGSFPLTAHLRTSTETLRITTPGLCLHGAEEDPRDYRLLNPNDAEEELLPDDSDSDSEPNSGT